MDNLFKETAEYHMALAHQAVRAGNTPAARRAYSIAVRAWRKAVKIHPSLINYLVGAEREYLRFVKTRGLSLEAPGRGGLPELLLGLGRKFPLTRPRTERRLPPHFSP